MDYDKEVIEELRKNLYENRNLDLCDLFLITNDDKRIPVHKIVLISSKSQYLKMHINGNLNDSDLYLPISSNQLEIIVKYLYTGEINIIKNSDTIELYESGELFMLPFLQKYSTNKLLNSISMAFCLEYLRHSVKFSIQSLEKRCINFIGQKIVEFFDKYLSVLSLNELERILKDRSKLFIYEINLYRYIKKWIFQDYNLRKVYIDKLLVDYINFLQIPSINYHHEIENDLELTNNVNFRQKIISINRIKNDPNYTDCYVSKWHRHI